jgi:LuxR family maltose regulon positive regulatory protein
MSTGRKGPGVEMPQRPRAQAAEGRRDHREDTYVSGAAVTPASEGAGWIERARLLEVVNGFTRDRPAPVVMVSGPGGAGKSILARQLHETDGRARLELPISARLDEPAALTRALVDLLETVGPPAPNLHSSIGAAEPGFSTVVLPALARLVQSRTRPYTVVIDDVHLLRHPASREVLRVLCGTIPPACRVILLSRDPTPAWLARVRAEGRLLEVSESELQFDVTEAAELLHRQGVSFSAEDVHEIVRATEGWAVAIYLTAWAMSSGAQSAPSAPSTRVSYPLRAIADYISTEILPPLDPDLRSFLLRTSILEELTPDLCDAVLLRNDSAGAIARLIEQLQLVIPLDAAGSRVRYHHLLSESLALELARSAPTEVTDLNRRASAWFADAGDLDAAIRHAKSAHDIALTGRLVWTGTMRCLGHGETDRLAFWLRDLTDEQAAHDPWLSLSAAWLGFQNAETDRMDRWILHCQRHAGAGWERRADEEPYAAALAFLVALVGRVGLDESLALCEASARGLPPEEGFRAAAVFVQGVALTLKRRADEGAGCLVEAERLARVLDVPLIRADSLSWRGVLALAGGDHATGQRLILLAREVILDHRLERLASSAHCITAQALVQALRGDPEAPSTLAAARRLTVRLGDVAPWFEVCGRLIQARAATALGDRSLAAQLILEARARMTADLSVTLAQDLLEDAEAALARLRFGGVYSPALTAAEMRVLQFLPSHLQLPQIAEHLFVTQNTVKTHVASIHRKLGVSSRAAAVERAQELGLLEAPAYD